MRNILDRCPVPPDATGNADTHRAAAPERARQMRDLLAHFLARAAAGTLTVRLPKAPGSVARGDGHFHLAAELFMQVSGWTVFRFPHGEMRLAAGEALVLPPRLLHAERVGHAAREAPFCNVVVYAEGPALTCHLAHEIEPGRPGILHLEAQQHAQAPRVHDWLTDAARLGRASADEPRATKARGAASAASAASTTTASAALPIEIAGSPAAWAELQARALVSAAIAGVLRALDDVDPDVRPEPPLVARTRVLVNNQLGDPALSVRALAEQAGCTADYLSHVFRQAAGEALAAYIVRLRMERAAHLLGQSELAGKEVAWACGFATQSYFIRSFRGHFGLTPRAWREARVETA